MKRKASSSLYIDLVRSMLLLLVMPLIIVTSILFSKIISDNNKNYNSSHNLIIEQAKSIRNQHIDNIYQMANRISSNASLNSFALLVYSNKNLRYYSTQLVNIVSPSLSNNHYIPKLYIQNNTIPRGLNIFYHLSDINTGLISEFLKSDKVDMWVTPAEASKYPNTFTTFNAHYTYIRKVFSNNKILYLLTLSVDQKDMDLFLDQTDGFTPSPRKELLKTNDFLIVNYSNHLLGDNLNKETLEAEISNLEKKNFIVDRINMPLFPQQLVFIWDANPQQFIIVCILLLISSFSFIFIRIVIRFIRNIFKSINDCLSGFEQSIQSGFFTMLTIHGNNEISQIERAFNALINKIQDLMNLTKEQVNLIKESQLKALQQQINPHFLYNTLEVFSYKMELYNHYEESDAMVAFSNILRYNTASENMYSTIQEELMQLENYMCIQRIKYQDISLDIVIPSSLYSCEVPRFILQPLVENCFSHGYYGQPMHIILTCIELDDYLQFQVYDNGIGLTSVEIDKINASLLNREDNKSVGIGLSNINSRLCLFYSDKCRLRLTSDEKKWMMVTFQVPKHFTEVPSNEISYK